MGVSVWLAFTTRTFRSSSTFAMALFGCLAACKTTTTVEPFYRPSDARIEQAFLSPDADFSR